jgi:UDPglucose--hexose-1-phosphate uridylyltransferase
MDKRVFTKPDGRALTLYARTRLGPIDEAPSPSPVPHAPNAHLRWHPFRAEWVAYATHRQHRTFLPPDDYSPLAVTTDASNPTELPAGDWDVAVFDNLFPTFTHGAHDPPHLFVPTAPALGACEVVVFTQDPAASLGALTLSHLELVIDVWADRYEVLGAHPDVAYVFPFENRGVEVGVTLHHPHGQLYAYPFVPPVPARALEQQRRHYEERGRGLLEDLIVSETATGERVIYGGEHAVAFMPVFARYPYEVWVAPLRGAPSCAALTPDERRDFARALKTVLMKYDALWQRPFPYILAMHQAPTDGVPHPEAHVHIELYPAFRMKGRLKYLAGSEIGAGVFTADTVPEEKVKEFQAVAVDVDA